MEDTAESMIVEAWLAMSSWYSYWRRYKPHPLEKAKCEDTEESVGLFFLVNRRGRHKDKDDTHKW